MKQRAPTVSSDLPLAERIQQARDEFRRAAQPLLDDLAAAGYHEVNLESWPQSGQDYRSAVPILLEWLVRFSDVRLRTAIIRALSVPWAGSDVAGCLIEEYQRADSGSVKLRWVIGSALSVVANDSVFERVSAIAQDRQFGRDREMVVLGLANMTDSRTVPLLVDLLSDEDVAGHAVIALGKLGAENARSHVEPFLKHPKPWIRNEARKAIASFDKNSAQSAKRIKHRRKNG
jgi:hypothetical protein